jgi:hypothetical protein
MKLLSFREALALVPSGKRPRVLLGNGFSRACRDEIFAYGALFDRADFRALSAQARMAFNALGTTDFEVVMRALRNAAQLTDLYADANTDIATRFRADANGLREVLANAIAQSHPSRPSDISDDEYRACRMFLSNFDRIYTLNYYLLLYWAVMHEELEPELRADDGFRTPAGGEAEYVTWEVENTDQQNIFYLHGAMHIYDAGTELKKFTWINTGVPLIDQIRSALAGNLYPLIVAEGHGDDKLNKINHSNYLSRAYRSFQAIGGSLFIYGHSMAENDEHITRLIGRGKVRQLMVGVHGNLQGEHNQRMTQRANAMYNVRTERNPLEIYFFDSASVNIWGHN